MFRKTLIPTDFTDEADQVLHYSLGLKDLGMREVVLIHVIDVGQALLLPVSEKIKSTIAEKLAERAAIYKKNGIKAKTIIAEGEPIDKIIEQAEKDGVSLIVTGSHGKRLVDEFLGGSVSEGLGRKSDVPILILRYDILKEKKQEELAKMADQTFKRILLPHDFSPVSKKALGYARKLKQAGAEEIVLLHIVDSKRLETEQEERELLAINQRETVAAENEIKRSNIKTKSYCQVGDPLHEILTKADDEDISLIVMGSHGKGIVKEWLLGSVSLNVIRTANRPALIVHEG